MTAVDRCGNWRVPVVLLAALATACAGTGPVYREEARVSLVSIRPLAADRGQPHYGLALGISNPTGAALPLGGLTYSVEINGREFAYGVSRQAVTIPAQGEAVIDVEVVSGLLGALQPLQADQDQPHRLDYRITGQLSLSDSAARMPFDCSGKLDWLPATDGASSR